MKNILKFVANYFTQVILFIYVVLVKLAPVHSYALWFTPKEFLAYTTAFKSFVAGNTGTAFGLLMLVCNIVLIVKLYKLQKKAGDADKPKPKTRSERHQRSVK
ncbi:hypothetical protein FOT98_09040 [Bacillus sp. HY001]|uniref:hypothetical protein n=1 Tax=Bacillus TaxID=1386 RepID=UPI0011861EFD|nr:MULTISPECIES: hypothetical protein [Bacillus]TSI19927.1 hypothetical protein FOT98_09040 [Bacillus sp. HY001]